MPGRGPERGGSSAGSRELSAEEFAAHFQEGARILWTVAAGVLGDPSEAEDVLQEAAVMALGKLDQFDRGTNFNAWMGRFVRNVALNHARKRVRRSTRPVDPELMGDLFEGEVEDDVAESVATRAPVDDRGELLADQGAFDDDVVEGLRELGGVQRAALLLRTVAGLPYREVARVLEIPEGTAMSHVHRARTLLRVRLAAPPALREGTLEMGRGA